MSTKDVSHLYWVLKAGSKQTLASISDSFLEKVCVEWQSHGTLVTTLSTVVWTHSNLFHAVQRTYFDILPEVLRSRHRKLLLLLGSTTAATATTSSRQGLDLPQGLQESARVMIQPICLIQDVTIHTCQPSWELMDVWRSVNDASAYVLCIHHVHPFCSSIQRLPGFKDSSEGSRQQRNYSRHFNSTQRNTWSHRSVKDFQSPFRLCMRLTRPSTCRTLNHVYGACEERSSPHPQVLILHSLWFPSFMVFSRFSSLWQTLCIINQQGVQRNTIWQNDIPRLQSNTVQGRQTSVWTYHLFTRCCLCLCTSKTCFFSILFTSFHLLLGRFSTSVSKSTSQLR